MPMYNLIEYSDNYADYSGGLYQFKRDESPMNNAGYPLNFALNVLLQHLLNTKQVLWEKRVMLIIMIDH